MSRYTQLEDWYRVDQDNRGSFLTTKPLEWEIGKKGSGLWLTVPIGTPFDVSVPKWLFWLIDPLNPQYFKAAALHDFALSSGWDRVSAAAAFSNGLRAGKVEVWKHLILVLCVIAWNWS